MDFSDGEYPPSPRRAFPFKLYEMLEYASDHGLASIVWAHDGEAFEIIDADALMDDVAPLFFNQSKFRSFTRESLSGAERTLNVPLTSLVNVSQANSIFGVSAVSRNPKQAGGTTTLSGATSTGSL